MFRCWRILFSLICLALCCAVCVMWWRSYRWVDTYYYRNPNANAYALISYGGAFCFAMFPKIGNSPLPIGFRSERVSSLMEKAMGGDRPVKRILGFSEYVYPKSWGLGVPYWFSAAVFGAIAGLPWYLRYVPVRFGLRTLLILFTFVAALFGYIVWAIHATSH
jgi:hypothetical protein